MILTIPYNHSNQKLGHYHSQALQGDSLLN